MGSKTILGIIIFAVIAVIIAIFLVARGFQSPKTPKQTTSKVEEAIIQKRLVSITDINNDPLVYESLSIETEAEINDWVTKRAFTLSVRIGGGMLGGGRTEQLLVVSKNDFKLLPEISPKELGLGETVNVNVKGRVRFVDRETLEEILGISLDNELIKRDDNSISKWDKGSVLLLESVVKK